MVTEASSSEGSPQRRHNSRYVLCGRTLWENKVFDGKLISERFCDLSDSQSGQPRQYRWKRRPMNDASKEANKKVQLRAVRRFAKAVR